MVEKAILSWSSGKDSAWALHVLRARGDVEVVGLLTTMNQQFGRVAMHAVRQDLLRAQAEAAGLPLHEVPIPYPCSNEQYEEAMSRAVRAITARGVTVMAFGDLYLQDIRDYRCQKLAGTGLRPDFPLWHLPTAELSRTMIRSGLRARLTCLDPRHLPGHWAGRDYDESFLEELPASVDPCGENGEFHSFAYAGPMFRTELQLTAGEIVERDGFVFADFRLTGAPT
jgi:uncharacterized protein (TIGR00290 family)